MLYTLIQQETIGGTATAAAADWDRRISVRLIESFVPTRLLAVPDAGRIVRVVSTTGQVAGTRMYPPR